MVDLVCPSCGHEWENKNHEQFPKCPECGEKVSVRQNINWKKSGSVFAKIHSEE